MPFAGHQSDENEELCAALHQYAERERRIADAGIAGVVGSPLAVAGRAVKTSSWAAGGPRADAGVQGERAAISRLEYRTPSVDGHPPFTVGAPSKNVDALAFISRDRTRFLVDVRRFVLVALNCPVANDRKSDRSLLAAFAHVRGGAPNSR